MINIFKVIMILSFVVLVIGCSTNIEDYKQEEEKFDIKEYFNGDITAWGMVQNKADKVTRRFCVEINAKWDENTGVLAEKFYFNDGEVSYRDWTLVKQNNGSYIGTAGDVIGDGTLIQNGFAVQLKYNLLLIIDNSEYEVKMDDWMYQLDEHRVFNKTAMSKFGINVANITLFFDKEQPVKSCTSFI